MCESDLLIKIKSLETEVFNLTEINKQQKPQIESFKVLLGLEYLKQEQGKNDFIKKSKMWAQGHLKYMDKVKAEGRTWYMLHDPGQNWSSEANQIWRD